MSILTLDLGHLSVAKTEIDPGRRAEFVTSFQERVSPVTLALTSDSELYKVQHLAQQIRERYKYVLVLGIGGSALGARAIISFIHGPFYNLSPVGPRLFIIDNLDPKVIQATEAQLDLAQTCIIYISKSGSTPETAATFMYFSRRVLEAGGSLQDTVIICDPGDNGINHIAGELGCHLLHLPARLPGRYSVLSAAGLLPAALTGVDITGLLHGAWAVQQLFAEQDQPNPLLLLGEELFFLQQKREKNIHVLFNYASIMADFGLWYMQLWGESLGKAQNLAGVTVNAGSTPLSCVGATDQHSLLQLFKEGPADKVFGFIGMADSAEDLIIPAVFGDHHEYSYLAGHSLQHQLATEQMATQISLVNTGHPCYQITVSQSSATGLGALFYFYQSLVAYMAFLEEINAYDQPGVEEGKQMTYSLLGRTDYQQYRAGHQQQVDDFLNRCRRYPI